ncbi:YbbR-like domain-containing protein [Mongoliitalea daihaiensis]|uniref:YbbR-like domain-containing protein n=1 Tax=Mongoliitalea daihaiensis TaxID=2782006 RepID=UPI001F208C39|nr:YbbR-like domain-containing protein [Mongoliitalea daihaiensis]UJP65642.1 YbbR-like domain-containing protein [Mongoliitalea daihaiensis]
MAKINRFFPKLTPEKVRNLKVAAACFLAAATFWVLNALNKDNYNTVVDYPIEIIFDETEFMAVDKLPSRVTIEVNGNGWDLLRKYFKFNETPFLIEINNPSTKDYLLTSDIRRSLAENISPTSLISMVTDTVKFKIDKIVTRKIKIAADTSNLSLAKNFRLASAIEIDPAIVSVKGPTSILQKLNGELLVTVDENKLSGNYNKILPLELPSGTKEYLELDEESVHIRFEVFQLLEGNKRLKTKLTNFPKTASLKEDPGTIVMSYLVDERKAKQLSEMDFEAVINYANRNRDDSTVRIQISPNPSFLENVVIKPEVLKIKYE